MADYCQRSLLHFCHFRSQDPSAPPSASVDGLVRRPPWLLVAVAARCLLPWTVEVAASSLDLHLASVVACACQAVADGGHLRSAVVRGGRAACSAAASGSWGRAAGASSRRGRARAAASFAVADASAGLTWWWRLAAVEVTAAATAWQPNLVVVSYYLVIGMLAVGPGASALRPSEAACLVLHRAAAH